MDSPTFTYPLTSNQQGFTLIEAMIAVVIVAILAAMVVPSYRDFIEKNRVKDAAEAIHGFIQQAKSDAVTRDTGAYINIQEGADWCVGYIPDPDGATDCDCTDDPASCVTVVGEETVGLGGTAVTQIINNAEFPDVSVTTGTASIGIRFRRLRGDLGGIGDTINISSGDWGLQTIISPAGRIRTCAPTGQVYKGVTGYTAC